MNMLTTLNASAAGTISALVDVPASPTGLIAGRRTGSTTRLGLTVDTSGRVAGHVGSQVAATIHGITDLRNTTQVLTLTYSGTLVKLYVGPVEEYSGAQVGSPAGSFGLRIGSGNLNTVAEVFCNFNIYKFFASNDVLTPTEVAGLTNFFNGASFSNFFAADGCSHPIYDKFSNRPAIYNSNTNATYFAWQAWHGADPRDQQIIRYDHNTKLFGTAYIAGLNGVPNDSHGCPMLCLDHEGHLHMFHGAHNTPMLHSSTSAPDDVSTFVDRGFVPQPVDGGDWTYPDCHCVDGTLWLFMRRNISGDRMPQCYVESSALASGVAAWGNAFKTIVDFGTSTRTYRVLSILRGTDIHMFFLRSTLADDERRDAYHFIFDTTTESIRNSDGSVVVATGAQPVLLAQADTSFRIFASPEAGAGHKIGGFAAAFDAAGEIHFVFTDSQGGVATVKEMVCSAAGVWGSPVDIFETSHVANSNALIVRSNGTIDMYSADAAGSVNPDRGGSIYKRVRSVGGAWGASTLVLGANVYRLDFVAPILNGRPEARVLFTEFEALENAENGTLKVFAYGDGGPLRKLVE